MTLVFCPLPAIADEGAIEEVTAVTIDETSLDEMSFGEEANLETEEVVEEESTSETLPLADEAPLESGQEVDPEEYLVNEDTGSNVDEQNAEPAPLGAPSEGVELEGAIQYSGYSGSCPWTIDSSGLLTIGPGKLSSSWGYSGNYAFPWLQYASNIKKVVVKTGTVASSYASYMFEDCTKLVSADMSGLDVSSVREMSGMFSNCSSLASVATSGWNTSSVTDMSFMFSGCSKLASLDLSHWDVSAVREMSYMFSSCSSLKSLNVSKWDVSGVGDMNSIFEGCSSLTSLDLSGWNTSAATGQYSMSWMFSMCPKLSTIKVGKRFNVSRAFPEAEAGNGVWWSSRDRAWYTVAQIKSKRKGIADTYHVAAPLSEIKLIPIYRMYNVRTSEHLWTKSKAEYDSCGRGNYIDWRQENMAWYSPNIPAPTDYYSAKQSTLGSYVYVWRLYDKYVTGDHIYLTYGAEMRDYLSRGWVVDKGAGFWTLKNGAKVSGRTSIPIYRAYNPKLSRGKHHYTPSKVEYDSICKHNGWTPEGTKFYVVKK